MYQEHTKQISRLTIKDFLTVDAYDKIINVRKARGGEPVPLVSAEQFFGDNGLYVQPQVKGLKIIHGEDYLPTPSYDEAYSTVDKLIKRIDASDDSYVLLIEGYAGCGKSTLVQAILQSKFGNIADKEYSLYNYNIEANNRENITDDNGNIIKNSSIFSAIVRCFIRHFYKYYSIVYEDFKEMIDLCRNYLPFDSAYYAVISDQFQYAVRSIENGDQNAADNMLFKLLSQNTDPNCILAIDFILRLAMLKKDLIGGLYICYDNLDKIEDAVDLKGFDNKLTYFRQLIDSFISRNYKYFDEKFLHVIPRFVIIATYRKITSVLAELDRYNEVNDDFPHEEMYENVIRIDATSTYSYKKIVEKRTRYFSHYFNNKLRYLNEDARKSLKAELLKLEKWNELNKSLIIMQDRYAVLWNKNYRTCSEIARILFSDSKYNFDAYIKFIKGLSKSRYKKRQENTDGYNIEKDEQGNNILCSYYGKSAILLNCVCRVFKHKGIWDNYLNLTKLHPVDPQDYVGDYKDVSLSRLILTLIYNRNHESLETLYNTFCAKGLFTAEQLCDCLSKMIARNSTEVWRRPLYYYTECILASSANAICTELLDECKRIMSGQQLQHAYSFQLCDSGRAYVERLMSEFEFYSSRLLYKNAKDNLPLYMYNSIPELTRVMHDVFCSVNSCCSNMIAFGEVYKKLYGLTQDQYLDHDIHPKTNRGKRQLHIERIVFAHIGYLNKTRLYYIDAQTTLDNNKRMQYNILFVKQIEQYLKLYNSLIYKISADRADVYEKLSKRVSEVLEESIKQEPNEEILFQSIALQYW